MRLRSRLGSEDQIDGQDLSGIVKEILSVGCWVEGNYPGDFHLPIFILLSDTSSAPWYLNAERPSLKHQRKWKSDPDCC